MDPLHWMNACSRHLPIKIHLLCWKRARKGREAKREEKRSKWKLCDDFGFVRFIICHIVTRYNVKCIYLYVYQCMDVAHTHTHSTLPTPRARFTSLPIFHLYILKGRFLSHRSTLNCIFFATFIVVAPLYIHTTVKCIRQLEDVEVKLLSNKWWNDW